MTRSNIDDMTKPSGPLHAQSLADRITSVDHVAIAVPSMSEATTLFTGVLGAQLLCGGDNLDTGIKLIHLKMCNFKIELMQPLHGDSIMARGIEKRGYGFHHMTFMVDDLPMTIEALNQANLPAVDINTDSAAWSEAFLSPRSTFGTLLQFVSTNRRWDLATDQYSLDDVLAGRAIWKDHVACLT